MSDRNILNFKPFSIDYLFIVSQAESLVRQWLENFASSPNFSVTMGDVFGKTDVTFLQQQWQSGAVEFPEIEILSKEELKGAFGGFARSNYTIYLAREFLRKNANNIPLVAKILLQELGHAIEANLSPEEENIGDEGEFFAAVVTNKHLTNEEIKRIKTEDDSTVILVDGEPILIEQASFNLGAVQGSRTINENLIFYDYQDYFTFELTSRGNSDSYINAYASSIAIDLMLTLYNQSGEIVEIADDYDFNYNDETLSLSGLPAGIYTVEVSDFDEGQYSVFETPYTLTFNTPENLLSDLTPYQPSGWSDKLVISTTTDTNTDASQITNQDTIYIDWAYLNQGDTSTSNTISMRLLLDGRVIHTDDWTNSLRTNYYVFDEDIQINPLSAGNHTLEIEVDYFNQETEKIETNNSYSRTFTVINAAQSDLTPYQPRGWSNKVVISTTTETNTDASQIFSDDTLYLDWAYLNQGNAATQNAIATRLLLNNDVIHTDTWIDPLRANFYVFDEDIEIGPLTAGNYTLRLEVDYLNQETETLENNNVFSRTFTVRPGNIPVTDLTPYKPSHWDDRIVVSTVEGTYADASQITSNDRLYIDWAYANFGEGETKNPLTTRLLVDGDVIDTWNRSDPLASNYYTWVDDVEIAPLSAGNHTIRLEVDYGNNELETNENNNVYEKKITVINPAESDLTPYKPRTWDDKIVISTQEETNDDAVRITDKDDLYIDWAYLNQGEANTHDSFETRLLLDGVEIEVWERNKSLQSNYYSYVEDFKIDALSAGNHTLTLEVDYLNQENETVESNNVFEKTFTVVSTQSQADLTPYQPTGWSDKLVLSTVTGTTTDATTITTDNTVYLDWAYINQGEGATDSAYRTRLLLDGEVIKSWRRESPLDPNTFSSIRDIDLGKLSPGTHTVRLEVDYENSQEESNENNNIFERTFTVESRKPTNVPSTGNNAFDLIDIDVLRSDPLYQDIDGSGLSVVVIDTGLWGSHQDLVKNFKAFVDLRGNNSTATTIPSSSRDYDGHGTHVAGTIGSSNPAIGVAPEVGLIGFNLLESLTNNTFNNTFNWILNNRTKYNIVAVNMSLGDNFFFKNPSEGVQAGQRYWVDAIEALEKAGITVVSSSANNYAGVFDRKTGRKIAAGEKEGLASPAIFSTINVGAVWQDDNNRGSYLPGSDPYQLREQIAGEDRLTVFSNRLDATGIYDDTIFAPGAMIHSTIPNNKYAHWPGTSMASPHVAGIVALMQEAAIKFGGKLLEPSKINQIIHDTADFVYDTEQISQDAVKNTGKTFRRINAYKAVEGVKNFFAGFTSNFTPLGAFADANGTFDGSIIGVTLNGTQPVTLNGSLGIDGVATDMGDNDVDFYQFSVESPGTLTIELKASSNSSQFTPLRDNFLRTLNDEPPNLQDVDTLLRLFNANKQEIAFDDDSGDGSFSKLIETLAVGDYFVGVSGAGNRNYDPNQANSGTSGATGNYAISFSLSNDDPNGIITGATDVNFGTYNTPYSITEVLGTDNNNTFTVNTSDVDLFKVIVPDNGQLLVDVDTPYNDNFANTFLRIFDQGGTEVFSNDDGLFFSDVLLESNETTNNAQPNQVFEGTTFRGHTTDSFLSGAVKRGEIYYIGVSNFDHTGYDPHNFNNRPQGGQDDRYDLTIQFVNNDLNGSITQARSDIPLPVANVPGLIGKDAINNNGIISFKEVGDRDVDFVKIKSPNAGILDIEAVSSTVDPVNLITRIFDQEGNPVAENNAPDEEGNSRLQLQIEANKDYFVAIAGLGNSNFDPFLLGSGLSGDTGEYTLNMRLLPSNQFAPLSDNVVFLANGSQNQTIQTIDIGDIITGDIGTDNNFAIGPNDLDIYKLIPSSTGNLQIRTFTIDALADADTFLRFFDESGTELAFNDDADNTTQKSSLLVDVMAGETYYIGVNGFSDQARNYNPLTGENTAPGSTGSYGLSVLVNNSPTNLILSHNEIAENSEIGSVIGNLTTLDPNEENIFNYSLVAGAGSTDNHLFTIQDNQLLSNTIFDFETKNLYNIRVRTTDSGGLSYEKELSINVTNITEIPTGFNFNTNQNRYHPSQTLTLAGSVNHGDGGGSLKQITLWLQRPNLTWTALSNIETFENNGDFNQSFSLAGYGAGTYQILARVEDQQGAFTPWITESFTIANQTPRDFTLNTNQSVYHPSQTLTLSGNVIDDDGANDLGKVTLWLQQPNFTWTALSDIETFENNGNFNQSFSLAGYGVGTYNIWSRVQDKQGAFSDWVTESFTIANQVFTSQSVDELTGLSSGNTTASEVFAFGEQNQVEPTQGLMEENALTHDLERGEDGIQIAQNELEATNLGTNYQDLSQESNMIDDKNQLNNMMGGVFVVEQQGLMG